ncbi:polyribonucleotide nucleotidyltransferase [Ilumatobacter coccineus]|jgi:polyribonucleotide nucleotidyltransferase|uniref:Polyribonucleotide nucleotidyltransferase n=1 Tax=Ilumatobacter coccineus (strain NBRC 103263 / KCTC 29153 / YM16-304) TaxID=1313172 RepID=A0A6C7E779_ILUCY|nr:polyribonucleotide nucleotidyltransferase [Ilumatobacter coccineus]BAN01922.1 polyribonucleotide nucleotidyltransferase [Ilumatobacter coccineus YM16-304]
MAEAISVSGPISGTDKTLTFETGKFAPQSQGAVVASIAGTKVLTTANAAKSVRDGMDFFPLTVDVEERAYAAGKIPGSFFRREGRPTEDAILTCRLTDRPLRPSFPEGFRHETQVVTTVLGADQVNPHDVLSINAASAALMISGIPFDGPLGTVRMAYSQEGEWIPHPTFEEAENGTFEIVIAGRELDDGDVAVMMVEAGGSENAFYYYEDGAKKVTEEVLGDALQACKVWIKESIALQRQLVASVIATHGPIEPMSWTPVLDYTPEIMDAVEKFSTEAMKPAVTISAKAERNAAVDAVAADAVAHFCGDDGEFPGQSKMVKEAVRSLMKKVMRRRVLDEGIRIDGRAPGDLREVTAEVGVLPTAHGSGLFQRGETQVMNVLTLAMPRMNQMIDSLNPNNEKRYLHHYNMPPWANGETGRVGSPKRREIGHGALAARAVLPVIPNQEDFAYTLRLVSEVMASNGSTSMGSVCASSLSLMDAGVPVKSHVSGIAMGLIHEDGKYVTLTDILGAEDAMGDMDFKVAGTEDAITALQLDTKIDGIPADVLSDALAQARVARLTILDVMNAAIPESRSEVADTAPKITTIYIPLDKVGEVIGPKGKVINTIQQETGADIGVDDDGARGIVTIGAVEAWRMEEAKMAILNIVDPPKAELDKVYMGRVVNITKFGAFVNILPGRDGLVHISKMGGGRRINSVDDVLELGQEIEVKVDEIDDKGKVSLTPTSPLGGDGGDAGSSSDGGGNSGGGRERRSRNDRNDRGDRGDKRSDSGSSSTTTSDVVEVSFEDSFDAELADELGDLGPKSDRPKGDRDGGNRGGGSRRRHR